MAREMIHMICRRRGKRRRARVHACTHIFVRTNYVIYLINADTRADNSAVNKYMTIHVRNRVCARQY